MSKLTTKAVIALRAAYRKGVSVPELMEQYQIGRKHLCDVITGAKWAMVPGAVPLRRRRPGPRPRPTTAEMLAAVTCECGRHKSKRAQRCRDCAAEAAIGRQESLETRAKKSAAARARYAALRARMTS